MLLLSRLVSTRWWHGTPLSSSAIRSMTTPRRSRRSDGSALRSSSGVLIPSFFSLAAKRPATPHKSVSVSACQSDSQETTREGRGVPPLYRSRTNCRPGASRQRASGHRASMDRHSSIGLMATWQRQPRLNRSQNPLASGGALDPQSLIPILKKFDDVAAVVGSNVRHHKIAET